MREQVRLLAILSTRLPVPRHHSAFFDYIT